MGLTTHLGSRVFALLYLSLFSLFFLVHSDSSSIDATVMLGLKQSLNNATSSLGWTDPDPCNWQYVNCSDDRRVTRIQIGNRNLTGFLPQNLGFLTALQSLNLSYNNLSGPLPSLDGLSSLQDLSLSNNSFSSIPVDFFFNMTSLESLYLDNNPFSRWLLSDSIQTAWNLRIFSANACNVTGIIPSYFGWHHRKLRILHLAFNELQGGLPDSFMVSSIQSLKLNGQQSIYKLNGSIDVIQNMTQLTEIYLHSNNFMGTLPDMTRLTRLNTFSVRDNNISGQVPASFVNLTSLKVVSLANNLLQGPTPKFDSNVTVDMNNGSNSFCLSDPGVACDPLVNTLLSIAESVGYPMVFAENWKGNDPCNAWFGLYCQNAGITAINFSNLGLTGTISPNFSSITSLQILILANNNISSTIPNELTTLPNLIQVNVSNNQLSGIIPSFKSDVIVDTDGNPNIKKDSVPPLETYRSGSRKNILGRGGFGTVYKGRLYDGTMIAVKRMESGVVSESGWNQFKSEIVVLSKVRHRHLVSLLGYCLDRNERLLVYEYMPQGTLSRHLFRWKEEGLKPLEWLKRLTIAVDVARGVEYLHGLADQSFIHRDLKPSNILLGDDMHAKVGDFGFVHLAPDGKSSILTKLAGTFGYLAPEYAVTGKVTIKVDVFSFGVVLMQLITGRKAVIEHETEQDEFIGIVTWFHKMRMQKNTFHMAIDPTIDFDEEMLANINTVAELASQCCANKPSQRPDMSHSVNVLSGLVEHWKPSTSHCDEVFRSFGDVKSKDDSYIFPNEWPQFSHITKSLN
ncbi:Receptor protein kinase TMK1 [Camellia lanceoleosa]|uniref:Receptor protein kinase TMK1 n=1 Tax=Camellia lanceoleosa TaxID=1840588 RepID=A0ACC0FYA9_9ERIC|nr:Receptor protein kinase TMK1 [Camellia lanceoleosa]